MNAGEYARMYEVEDRHWWYVALHRLVLDTVEEESRRRGRTLEVLDAGCGTGRLCQLLSARRHRVTGCDHSEEALRLSRARGLQDLFRADLNALELTPERFDVVTSIDVLYHASIHDDVSALARLRDALRPGGLLVVHVVALELLRGTHDVAVHTRERYTRGMLVRRLQAAGFSVERVTYRVGLLLPLIAARRIWSRLSRRAAQPDEEVASDVAMPAPVLNRVLQGAMGLERVVGRRLPLPLGSSLFAIARRPT